MTTVLHVILSLEIGGMEQVTADLVRNLDRSRFKPVVVCLNSAGPLADELQTEGITVMLLKPMIPVLSFLFPWELVKVIRQFRADVIHVHCGCWHKAAMAGWLAGVKTIIYTDHGRSFPDSWKTILLDRIYSRITHHVVAVSGQLAEYLHTVVRLDRRKIRVIINGIDTRSFVPLTSGVFHPVRRIGIIARLVPVKDVATLLRAFKLVREKFPGIRLDVVGDGPERGSLEILAEELSISSSVMFHGFRRDIAAVLQEIDIFVLSSRSEGTSITLLEAMAAGKPVVVTNVGGSSAVVENGVNGFLVPSQNVEYMAAALHQLVNDDDLRNKMSMNNIASVDRQYSIRSMVRSYEKLYG